MKSSITIYHDHLYISAFENFIWFWFICWRIVNIVIEPSHQITINEWKTHRVHMPVSIFVFFEFHWFCFSIWNSLNKCMAIWFYILSTNVVDRVILISFLHLFSLTSIQFNWQKIQKTWQHLHFQFPKRYFSKKWPLFFILFETGDYIKRNL